MRKGKRLIAWIMAVVMLFTICVFGGNGTAEAATVNLLCIVCVQIRQNRIANTWKIGYIYGWYC